MPALRYGRVPLARQSRYRWRDPHPPLRSGSPLQKRVDEGLRVERRQVVRALAEAHQLDRHTQLALHGDDDAALGRAVQLGQDDLAPFDPEAFVDALLEG